MKKIFRNIFVSTVIFGLTNSCSTDDEECNTNQIAYVTSVDSPDNGNVNQIINVQVKFGVRNGCGNLGKFIESNNGNIRTIEVEAKYEGCMCTQDMPIRTVNYEFIPTNAGDYELKFKSSSTEFITVNLIVN